MAGGAGDAPLAGVVTRLAVPRGRDGELAVSLTACRVAGGALDLTMTAMGKIGEGWPLRLHCRRARRWEGERDDRQ